MTNGINRLCLGSIVRVIRGREAGAFAVVVHMDQSHHIWLADGALRKADRPKKKNRKHVQPTNYIAQEVEQRLQAGDIVSNAQLRFALNQYKLLGRS